ncbi:MAG: 50S ribosomal protein L13 [Candidatus Pacebacteria bacterium]|nr:50S ribosomal protein L13 [Candidatus Paceibacterota bacterium]
MKKTYSPRLTDIKRNWHLIDLKDKVLGRVATQIAQLLMGKNKPYFASHLDCGDWVVAANAGQIKVTGGKKAKKMYYRHSGFPGGFKEISLARQLQKDSRQVIRKAVAGMLPKNKLRQKRLARLKVFVDEKHPYEDKFKGEK